MPVKSWLAVLGVASVVGLLAGQPALAILGRCSDFGTSSGYQRMQNFRASAALTAHGLSEPATPKKSSATHLLTSLDPSG